VSVAQHLDRNLAQATGPQLSVVVVEQVVNTSLTMDPLQQAFVRQTVALIGIAPQPSSTALSITAATHLDHAGCWH
jgi:hypothetical protein